ncbi:TlpA disulfide reductase family protein [Pedobacter frigoris]|uniref:TlpA family protein disulfide reductase n=1 Tax=Pedobacter frigoris TaxID=2571272 RepID=UPI00292FC868|nr:TlpA disulfide reductase family protein [Pedobacter frigoris]
MNLKILLFLLLLLNTSLNPIFGQNLKVELSFQSDTVVNSFTVFALGKADVKSDIRWNTSKFDKTSFTTTRSIYLKSIDETLGILIGENNEAKKFIVFDQNMNHDFNDDQVIYFQDTINSSSKGNYKTFNSSIKRPKGEPVPVTFDYTIIKPKALRLDLGDHLENKFFFAYRNRNYYSKQVDIGGKKFYFYLVPKKPLDFTRNSVKLFVADSAIDFVMLKKNQNLAKGYHVGDKITVNNEYYAINNISANGLQMSLTKITDEKPIGINVGFFAPELSFVTLENKKFKLSDLKTKYVLLEYWGTWCSPCKAILPSLKTLYEANKGNNLSIISIACNDKLDPVKKHIEKYQIDWIQVLNASNGNANFADNYEIDGYPGFLLIDSFGKIVFRDSGINGFDNLKNFIEANTK